MLEVVGVAAPRLLVVDVFLLVGRVCVELVASGVCQIDGIVQFCIMASAAVKN